MKMRLWVALVACWLAAGTTQAWKPSGWSWWSWPYAYESDSGDWYWFDTGYTQWVYGFPPANGWQEIALSDLASGWSWWSWPYAYEHDGSAWYYMNEIDTLWCVNLRTGWWGKFGEPSAPAGMVLVPSGSFQMGDSFNEGAIAERPVHTVAMSAFYMDRYEVTAALWGEVRAWGSSNGYTDLPVGWSKASDHPVQELKWYDCVKWCNARSEREGRTPTYYTDAALTQVYKTGQVAPFVSWWADGYRLPTEAEWEKAARGGSAGHRFPWSDAETVQHSRANYFSTNTLSYDTSPTRGFHPASDYGVNPYTSPCGAFVPNDYGLFDMAGNVYEWCWDWYGDNYYASSPSADPLGPASGTGRVLRGGSWWDSADSCRVACRFGPRPSMGGSDWGLRTVITGDSSTTSTSTTTDTSTTSSTTTAPPVGMALVPAGAFLMGNAMGATGEGNRHELPVHGD